MINGDTIDSHPILCNLTSSVNFTQDGRDNHFLTSEAPVGKPNEENMTSKPKSTNEINNLPTETVPALETRSILSLPNNILQLIFSYLDVRERFKTELVCRKWRLISKLLPWTNPVTLTFNEEAADSSLGIPATGLTDNILLLLLMRCGACLVTLQLDFECNDIVLLTRISIDNIGRCCPNLEVVRLENIPAVDDNALEIIALSCHNLRKFDIAYFSNNGSKKGVLDIVKKCEALESISIDGVKLAEDLFDVTGSRLSQISFVKCKQATKALQNLTANTKINLRKLTMVFFSNLMGADEITWFAVIDRFKVSLQSLTASEISMPTNINWCEGLKNLHNLLELKLVYCPSVNDDLIALIVNQCPDLQTLELRGSNVTDSGVAALNSLAHLKDLDISHNRNISARGFIDLVRRDALETLSVGCAPRITEEFCCSLAKKCLNLKELDVSGSKHMTKRLVAAFRDAMEAGLRQNPVRLCIARTSVKGKVNRCKGVEVDFTSAWQIPVIKKSALSHFK